MLTKSLIALAITTSVLNAGIFTTVTTWGDKEVKPTQQYTIDTAGLNPRAYTWTVPGSEPKMQCVTVFTESRYKAPTTNCWKYKKK